MGAQQEKVMKAQAFQNKDQVGQMSGRKTLELNPNHPVVVDLLGKVKADKDDTAALDTASTDSCRRRPRKRTRMTVMRKMRRLMKAPMRARLMMARRRTRCNSVFLRR